jgi:FkbM family methyltransferase
MSYFDPIFTSQIESSKIQTIFEIGSRDLRDARKLFQMYSPCQIYSFECNPDCLADCHVTQSQFNETERASIHLVEKAVSLTNESVSFYPFDLTKFDNKGASSMLVIDFSMRNKDDIDYRRPCPQTIINVPGTRVDTFMTEQNISNVDLICMDLQGYELSALKSFGEKLRDVKYIITETCIQCTYIGGATFKEKEEYLKTFGFEYRCSNRFGFNRPDFSLTGYSEFDALFVRV